MRYQVYRRRPGFEPMRQAVLRRAAGRCEGCRASVGEPHPQTGTTVQLNVAHLYHNLTWDSYFELAALCHVCHIRHDREHLINQRARYARKKREAGGQLRLNLERNRAEIIEIPRGCDVLEL